MKYDSDDDVLDYCYPDKGKRLYGVELEVEARKGYDVCEIEDVVADYVELDAILKYESSISLGFEIVTRPMTMCNQKSFWKKFTKWRTTNIPNKIRSYWSGECGMHVHVTKASISSLVLGKLLVFINEPANSSFVFTMAGRESRSWAPVDVRYAKLPSNIRTFEYDREKFKAVGFRYKTLEFRLFRGNLKLDRILANLEFVEASIMFAQDSSLSKLGYKHFVTYVLDSKRDWGHLIKLIKENNYAK